MGEESEAALKGKKNTVLCLQSSCMLKGPTLERHAAENNLQEMARCLVKISMGEKSPGFISPPDILNGYLHDKNCCWSTHLSLLTKGRQR